MLYLLLLSVFMIQAQVTDHKKFCHLPTIGFSILCNFDELESHSATLKMPTQWVPRTFCQGIQHPVALCSCKQGRMRLLQQEHTIIVCAFD